MDGLDQAWMLWTGYRDSRGSLRHGILASAILEVLLLANALSTLDLRELLDKLMTACSLTDALLEVGHASCLLLHTWAAVHLEGLNHALVLVKVEH